MHGCSYTGKLSGTASIIHFRTFAPRKGERNLIRGLVTKARRTDAEDTIKKELLLRNGFREKGYPERFITKTMGQSAERHKKATAEKTL